MDKMIFLSLSLVLLIIQSGSPKPLCLKLALFSESFSYHGGWDNQSWNGGFMSDQTQLPYCQVTLIKTLIVYNIS